MGESLGSMELVEQPVILARCSVVPDMRSDYLTWYCTDKGQSPAINFHSCA